MKVISEKQEIIEETSVRIKDLRSQDRKASISE